MYIDEAEVNFGESYDTDERRREEVGGGVLKDKIFSFHFAFTKYTYL